VKRLLSNWRVSVLAVVCVLAAVGCGDSHSSSSTASTGATTQASTPTTSAATTTAPTSTTKLVNGIRPPESSVLKPGQKVTISKATLNSVGWQVSCVAKGLRVNAESVRGQHTAANRKNQKGPREIIEATSAGTPSIWAPNKPDGSLVLSCR
jgi:hypothetical protein